MPDTFTCEMCGETFEKAWSDEEAAEEYRKLFGREPDVENDAPVCDDCYMKIMKKFV